MRASAVQQCVRQAFWAAAAGLASSLACLTLRLFFQGLEFLFTGHSGLLLAAATGLPLWRRALTPLAGACAASLAIWFGRRVQKKDKFNGYVEAVRANGGRLCLASTCWRTLSAAFSVATGAAIGREGSMIQFAAAITSSLRPQLVACGVAAAVAVVYQAPVAGVFFAAEIVLGEIVWSQLPFLLISALVGIAVSHVPLIAGPHGPLFRVHGLMHFNASYLWLVLLMAVMTGALGPLYCRLNRSLNFVRKWPFALLWSGALVGALSLIRPEVWGNGDAALLHVMQASPAVGATLLLLALRLAATAFCVGTGTIGGVFTPTLFAGGAIGLLCGHLLHAPDPVFFAILGMAGMLAATTHAPWMAAFMAVELTGQWPLFPMLAVCSLIAWQMARYLSLHSLYAVAAPEPAAQPNGRMSSLTIWKTFDLKSSV